MQLLNAKVQSEEVVGVVSLLPNSLNGKALSKVKRKLLMSFRMPVSSAISQFLMV